MKKLNNNTLHLKRKIINLALPATIENILETSVGFIDTLMISKIGLLAVAGVSVANAILNVYIALFIALGIGTSSIISRSIGAKDIDKAKTVSQQSLVLAIFFGTVLGIISIFAGEPILTLMGASNQSLNYSIQFFNIVGGGSIFIATMIILGSMLRAIGDTKSPMKIGIIVNFLNIILDFILIFGLGPIPALGVIGTAIGTLISRIMGTFLLYRKVQQSEINFSVSSIFSRSNYKELLNLSIPAALERLIMRLGQVVYFGLIVGLGIKTYAAHSIAGSIESFVYMPAYGLATAAAVLTGNSIGKKDYDETKRVVYLSIKYGIIILSLLGMVLFLTIPFIATLFTKDSEAIKQIIIALRIDAFNQPALAFSLIITGAIQGMGDTKSPLYSTAFGMWFVRILGVVLLGEYLHWGIAGIWIAIGFDLYSRSLFLNYKFNKNLSRYNQRELY
ncbi:MATE family efflux transporter [Lactococcus petauri]|uniref:Probable multidrug resistance protein NorM n=1 Tax=Lactococcus petauri TaxID=1940789 RepID=A0AAJ2IVY5_9LACT|nr:MATE family efflux transporter [Lactococcus petauri]MDT2583930.1 MATE family efflux transporter [Lactococcus petauri]